MKPLYTQILSKSERLGAMKLGAAMALNANSSLIKSAGAGAGLLAFLDPANHAKAVAIVSLLAGIPAGAAAHVIGRRMDKDTRKVRELKERIKYYRNASSGIESGLAAHGAYATQDTNVT